MPSAKGNHHSDKLRTLPTFAASVSVFACSASPLFPFLPVLTNVRMSRRGPRLRRGVVQDANDLLRQQHHLLPTLAVRIRRGQVSLRPVARAVKLGSRRWPHQNLRRRARRPGPLSNASSAASVFSSRYVETGPSLSVAQQASDRRRSRCHAGLVGPVHARGQLLADTFGRGLVADSARGRDLDRWAHRCAGSAEGRSALS